VYSFLNARQQEEIMCRSKMVITRSGYTTIMELYELDIKHALLIPTPGQTEQEYLADLYEKRGQYHHVTQYRLKIRKDIKAARKFKGFKQQGTTKDSVKKFMKIIGA
jgi:UDP-N-acetylglucosamine:LPS N-acetylglucosamine transferase